MRRAAGLAAVLFAFVAAKPRPEDLFLILPHPLPATCEQGTAGWNPTDNIWCTCETANTWVCSGDVTAVGDCASGDCFKDGGTGTALIFEGSSVDAIETTLTAANPTGSDKTITLPNESGTVCTTGSICSGYASVAAAGGWTDDGATVRLTTSSDAVGIGTTSPGAEVEVYTEQNGNTALRVNNPDTDGTASLVVASSGAQFLNLDLYGSTNGDAQAGYAVINVVGTSGMRLVAEAADNIRATIGSTDRLTVTSTGLDVIGLTETDTFKLTTSPTSGHVLTSDGSGNGTWASVASVAPPRLTAQFPTSAGAAAGVSATTLVSYGVYMGSTAMIAGTNSIKANLYRTAGATGGDNCSFKVTDDATGNILCTSATTISSTATDILDCGTVTNVPTAASRMSWSIIVTGTANCNSLGGATWTTD